jgi:hypothetical protein
MTTKPGIVTRQEARELKRRADALDRRGGIPHERVRARWLAKLRRELKEMVRAYDGTARKGRALLEAMIIAEEEGVNDLAELRHELGDKLRRRKAA